MVCEYKFVHARREHKKGLEPKKVIYTPDQQLGRFNFDEIHGRN